MLFRFPSALGDDVINKIISSLSKFIFQKSQVNIAPGKDICISNALYLYLILLNKYNTANIIDILYKSLEHHSYEVILTCLNYLLILYQEINIENHFQQHLKYTSRSDILDQLKNKKYINILCGILCNNKYMESQEKCLKLLILHGDTQRYLIDIKNDDYTDDVIIERLFEHIKKCNENLTNLYVESLLDYVTMKFEVLSQIVLSKVLKVLLDCSSSENCSTRRTVVKFLETNLGRLLDLNIDGLNEMEKCKYALFSISNLENSCQSVYGRISPKRLDRF